MTKLNQIVAVEKGVKSRAASIETQAYQDMGRSNLWTGRLRTYQPKDEDGDRLPSENQLVQRKARDVIAAVSEQLERLFDVVLTHEVGNAGATADIVVDGVTIISNVPVTYMLFLDRELQKLDAFVSALPKLDPEKSWTYSPNSGVFESNEIKTVRTRKINVPITLAPATKEHPAQVAMGTEDVIVGTWSQIELSGGVGADVIEALKARVIKLREAVKFAREEANGREIEDLRAGRAILDYVFEPLNALRKVD